MCKRPGDSQLHMLVCTNLITNEAYSSLLLFILCTSVCLIVQYTCIISLKRMSGKLLAAQRCK